MSAKAHAFAGSVLARRAARDVHHEHTKEVVNLAIGAEERLRAMIQALEDQIRRVEDYVSGQTLADIAYQAQIAVQEAEKRGDRKVATQAETYAAGLFGPDWRNRIDGLIAQGQQLDAAMLRAVKC